jgi:hypothetical protein
VSPEFKIDAELPYFSFEFDYRGRGAFFNWDTKPQLSKSMPAILPFRENWKVNGPTVIDLELALGSEFFMVVFNPKKLDVNAPAEANTIHNDGGAISFGNGWIKAEKYANNAAEQIGKIDKDFVKANAGQIKYRIVVFPATGVVEVATGYLGKDNVFKATFPA